MRIIYQYLFHLFFVRFNPYIYIYNNNTKTDNSTYQDISKSYHNINLFYFFYKPISKLFCSNESKEKFEIE